MKYCVYVRSSSWLGWLVWGWYLVQIFDDENVLPIVKQTIEEYKSHDYMRVYQVEPPIAWRFWFNPSKGRLLT